MAVSGEIAPVVRDLDVFPHHCGPAVWAVEVHTDGVRSADGLPVLHPVGYYTLNEIPAS